MRGSKRVPRLQFQHIDVSRAVDVMIKLDQLAAERHTRGSGDEDDDLDFDASEEDAFAEYDVHGGDAEASPRYLTSGTQPDVVRGPRACHRWWPWASAGHV